MEWILDKETHTSGLTYDKKADSGIKFLRQTDPGSDLIKKFLQSFNFSPLEFSSVKTLTENSD